eukprot:TRINITY_DN533_c0_g1_i3.p1 TRINITY_DN533_c0_g1~~TRINITY_DN533_c0_g1_i3.p1  ORF type:complete len:279 (+),score=40.25 TRINITY_DN533_c0_g1_i3:233-1069(+)
MTDRLSGAEYLQSIFGTEKDKVNCPFYFKIGSCRHGDKCERRHNKPTLSQTLLLVGFYPNPWLTPGSDDKKNQEFFEDFYEDIWEELSQYGEIEELNVCDNVCDHMVGNVYIKYHREDDAEKAIKALIGRFYGGKPIVAEFSPVTDFREASCRQYENHECTRGGHCNFMHLRPIPRDLKKRLQAITAANKKRKSRSRSRSRSPRKERRRSRSPRSSRRSRSRSPRRDDKRRSRSRSPRRDDRRRSDRDGGREREAPSHHQVPPPSDQQYGGEKSRSLT